MKVGGHNFHPSRISNRQKMQRKRDFDKFAERKKKQSIKPLDLTKQNWTTNK